jgi:hypothetical protein
MAKSTKKNPRDATDRNVRASMKRDVSLAGEIQRLKNAMRQTRSRITALERYARPAGGR